MNHEQYLDAISCPRIDPINKGRNIMRPLDADPDDFGLTTDEDQTSPIHRPEDAQIRYIIEGTCREMCRMSAGEHETVRKFLRKKFRANSMYAFLNRTDPIHRFFLWRLKRNRAKRRWNLKMLSERNKEGEPPVDSFAVNEPEDIIDTTNTSNARRESGRHGAEQAANQSRKPAKQKRASQRGVSGKRKGLG